MTEACRSFSSLLVIVCVVSLLRTRKTDSIRHFCDHPPIRKCARGGGGNSLRNPSFAQFQKGLPPRCEIAHLAVCVLAVFLLVLYAGFCLWNVQIAVRYSLRSPRALRARRARCASLVGACKCANGEVEGPSPPVIFCGGKRDVSGERFQFLGSEPFF